MNRRTGVFIPLLAAMLLGCGGADADAKRLPRFETSGKIVYQGKPLADASVTFHPVAEDGVSAFGRTDAVGYYELTTYEAGDGAAAGQYVVTVEKHDVPVMMEAEDPVSDEEYVPPEASRTPQPPPKRQTPVRYSSSETSDLKADVTEDGDNVFDYTLTE